MNPVYWISVYISWFFLKCFFGLKIKGKKNFPKGPAIIACNHVSFFDPPIIGASSPEEIHILANAYLFDKKFWGWIITRCNTHPVNAKDQDSGALKMVISILKKGQKVLIFPEGGRSEDGELMSFKLGMAMLARHVNVPVIPAYIDGAQKAWPKGKKWPNLGKKIKVTFGKPVYPENFEAENKKLSQKKLTEGVRDAIVSLKEGNPPL